MEAIFLFLYRVFEKRRLLLFSSVLVLMLLAGWMAFSIRPEEDISKMISGQSGPIAARVIEQSGFLDKIAVIISSSDSSNPLTTSQLIASGDSLHSRLKQEVFKTYIRKITYKTSDTLAQTLVDIVNNHLPLFLAPGDYSYIDSVTRPNVMQSILEGKYRTLLSPAGFAMKEMVLADPVSLGSPVWQRLSSFQNDDNFTLIDGHIFSRDRQNLLMFLSPVFPSGQTAPNTRMVRELRRISGEVSELSDNQVTLAFFGSALVAAGNADRLKRDIRLTLSISILLLGLIIGFSIRKKKLFPFIFLPAVFGGLMALAAIYLLKGSVSVISLSIGTVVLAITVDYALHITTHYKHRHSIIETIRDVSFPIVVCGFATAFEFLTLVFVSSESLKELGILAAVSVITAAFFTMVVMPHILDATRTVTDETEEKNLLERFLDTITRYAFHKNRMLLLFMLLVTLVSAFYMNRVRFESDMMKMNYMSPELLEAEEKLNSINQSKLHSIYLVAFGRNFQEALERNERVVDRANTLRKQEIIGSILSPTSLLPSDSMQLTRIRLWRDYWNPQKVNAFTNDFETAATQSGFKPASFNPFINSLSGDYNVMDSVTLRVLRDIFFVDNLSVTGDLATIISVVKTPQGMQHQAKEAFAGMDGVIVIDRKSALSGIVKTLSEDFSWIANVSLLLILGVLILAFGRLELGIITFVPIGISWVWTLGFMGIAGIPFNIFNIIISSFITGLGIDYSIYIMQGLVQGYQTGNRNLLSYKTCILISVLISVSGTGVLILAKHPALNSIALISVVGLLSVVLISYTFEPVLFYSLVEKRGRKRSLPVTASDLFFTFLSVAIAIAGSILLHILLLLTWVFPVPLKRKKLFMHRAMCALIKLPVFAMVHIRKKVVNPNREDFSKPAMIIGNHQSHIDLPLLLMLHPRIIVLTNKWVWNNPVYALVIRFLDYYPVMDGYAAIMDRLKSRVADGYSILVFPEGSRSPDSSVKRFHKGAFLLAENLGLDLLPVLIHGAGDVMTKGENHLKAGSVTLTMYPRVKPGTLEYGSDYHIRTRNMLTFFRHEFAIVREKLETPDYMRHRLVRNYLYKGPILEWYTRIKMRLENNYNLINSLVPRTAVVTDIGCGFGFLSNLLGMVSADRQIHGIDYDRQKIEMASHCISKPDNVSFSCADAAAYDPSPSDVIILSDVLHYLSDNNQQNLIERCVRALRQGGILLIRDADSSLGRRHNRTKMTEFFSTRFGFNKMHERNLTFFSSDSLKEMGLQQGLTVTIAHTDTANSNRLYVLNKKGETGG